MPRLYQSGFACSKESSYYRYWQLALHALWNVGCLFSIIRILIGIRFSPSLSSSQGEADTNTPRADSTQDQIPSNNRPDLQICTKLSSTESGVVYTPFHNKPPHSIQIVPCRTTVGPQHRSSTEHHLNRCCMMTPSKPRKSSQSQAWCVEY